MAWQMNAEMIECCSCKLLCPCILGPEGEPDRGWCSGGLFYDIEEGAIDGVAVDGCKVAMSADWPGNFFAGNGTARLYIDERASAEQRSALEAVFSGRKGGLFEPLMSAVIAKWLPTKTARIEIRRGDSIELSVGDIGNVSMKPIKDQNGRPASIQGTPVQAAFQSASMNIASSKGTRWADPELRPWEGDSGTVQHVSWKS